ncbi:MAG TPA: hypothetical protein DDZ67_14185, partial [Xanthomonadaceae bacterium]|nr:hypothetical protein [Xanthomonadaceae bacterium]
GRHVLLLAWSALVLAFFSVSPGKREVYLFPMLPALCIAAAPLLPGLLRRQVTRSVLAGYVGILALAALALGAGLLDGADWAMRSALERGIDAATMQAFAKWLCGFGLAAMAILSWARPRRIGIAVVATTALLWTVHGLGLMPALDPYSSSARLMQRVGQRIGPDAELGMVAWREQNLLQADRPVTDFGFRQPWDVQWQRAGAWLEQAPRRRWLFVLKQAMSPCVDPRQAIDIGESNRNRWQLVPGTAWKPGCVAPPGAASARDDAQGNDD